MSSGSILLQQLRSRQSRRSISGNEQTRKKSTSSDGNCNSNVNVITSSCDETSSAVKNASNVSISNQTVSSATKGKKKKVIEVCLGPDCAVVGGGAALLEIEDLVSQQCPNKESNINCGGTNVIVQVGGCRDQCTEGPNIRVLSNGGVEDNFHRVNNPETCRHVVSSVVNNAAIYDKSMNSSDKSSPNDVVARLLQRKEDARRWKEHRERASKERRLQAIARNQTT